MPEAYDYIVVGAGSSGSVAAARLSEDSQTTVLLLEAGGSNDLPEVHAPAGWPALLMGQHDWRYFSAPQRHCNDRVIPLSRAKMLGGCASHNANMWVRGHRSDFDGWADQGCDGWDFESILPIYKRIEDFADGGDDYRGVGGPLRIEVAQDPHPLATAFLEASQAVGLQLTSDLNRDGAEGVSLAELTIKDGKRHNVPFGYLAPAMSRENLTVRTNAHTHRLLLEDGRCVGVEYWRDGRYEQAHADAEVIVSAGAFGTPQLLMLSGIGPADHLRELGIDVVHDSPGVGRDLQDHVALGGVVYEASTSLDPPANNGIGALAAWRSDQRTPAADAHVLIAEFPLLTRELIGDAPEHGYTLLPCLIRPTSRGVVRLTSADPSVQPHIDMNYLATPGDRQTLRAALDLAREIGAAAVFEPFRRREVLPGAKDDAGMEDFIRNSATTYFHPTSTCRMGVDDMAVVDPQLRVHGIERLRIADASIMPTITSGNTNAPCVLIGERCADLLRGVEIRHTA